MDDDGDIQIVSFDKEKPPQFIPGNGQAGILPVPFQNNKLLDVIEEDSEEAEGYINELPPYSLVESIITNTNNINTTDRNCFSRYHYETFNDKTFSRAELDFSKFRKTMREVLSMKDTKTSLRRKRFTQSKLFRGPLQGHS